MDDRMWKEFVNEWSYVGTLYHIIDTLEFYSYNSPKDMKEVGELGINTSNINENEIQEQIQSKEKKFFLEYLEKVKSLVNTRIESFNESDLNEQDVFAEWGFKSRFHKFSYVLRHTMFHLGELNKYLRDNNRSRIKWL